MTGANQIPQIESEKQRHVLQFWDELSEIERSSLREQLGRVDWDLVNSFSNADSPDDAQFKGGVGKFGPPQHVVRKPKNADDERRWATARQVGSEILRQGKVAAILLAGGQGTRLGFAHPKGMFPIGPVSGKPLFAILAEQIIALGERYGKPVPYLVMTSDGTHDETIAFFELNQFFGLNRNDVFFFQQGYAPSLDARTGELFLADRSVISMNPDGHGGLLAAMLKAGLFDELRRRGIEYLFSHQVDNPLVKACDPELIGLHVQAGSEVSTKVVAKTSPEEKVGVAVDLDGRTAIVEYSDLSATAASERESDGGLRYWAGSTAIHLFDLAFLERVATSSTSLPWHRALKKIPHVDRQGNSVQPERENGIKFERFLFDSLPLAKTALIVETIRDEEFAPLKNREGDFSPDYVKRHLSQLAVGWLRQIGIKVPDAAVVEIAPRFAMTAAELEERKDQLMGLDFSRPVYFDVVKPSSSAEGGEKTLPIIVLDSFYRPQVWGGRKLKTLLKRNLPEKGPYGEAWDVSCHSMHVSRVLEGPFAGRDLADLWKNSRRELTGRSDTEPASFPLLIKWLECHELLSVQVHPDDQMAQRVLKEPYGKTEAWVVVAAEPSSRIYAGLKEGVTREDVVRGIAEGTLAECMHSFVPSAGDCVSLPAGTIHAVGGGVIIAEVQQSSDATFRLYDWDRLGFDGKPRPLQIERALEAINWKAGPVSPVVPTRLSLEATGAVGELLVDGPAFRMERYTVDSSVPVPHLGEFAIWMVLNGNAIMKNSRTGDEKEFSMGATALVPANARDLVWETGDKNRSTSLLCSLLRAPRR